MNLLQIQIIDDPNNRAGGAGGGAAGGAGYRPSSSPTFSPAPPPSYRPQPAPAPIPPPAPQHRAARDRSNPDLDEAFGYSRPGPAPAPPPPQPAGGDDWYKRYRELQNQYDRFEQEGRKLRDAELAELERLRKKLEEEANKPTPKPPAPPPPKAESPPADSMNPYRQTAPPPGPPRPPLDPNDYVPQPNNPYYPAPPKGWVPPGAGPIPDPGDLFDAMNPGPDAPLPWWIDPEQMKAKAHHPGGPDAPLPGWLSDEDRAKLEPAPKVPRAKPVDPAAGGAADKEALGNLFKSYFPKAGQVAEGFGLDVGAAGAAAGLGKLAAAAGPVAAALLAQKVVNDQVEKGFRNLAGAVDATGRGMQKLAGNDGLGMLSGGLEGTAKVLDEIPLAGPEVKALAGSLKVASAAARAWTGTVDAFIQQGRQLQLYNGSLAGANARAEVRSLLGDIREANRIGKDLARLTDADSRLADATREALLPLKAVAVKTLAAVEEKLARVLEKMVPLMEKAAGVAEAGWDVTEKHGDKAFGVWGYIAKGLWRLVQMEEDKKKRAEGETLLKEFGELTKFLPVTPMQPDPGAGAAGQRFNAPVFGQ